MTPIYAGDYQNAYFVHKPGLEETTVDVAAAFEQQPADSKALSEFLHGGGEVHRGFAGHNIRNSLLSEHGQVILRSLFADDADEVLAVEVAASPTKFPECVNADGVRLCAAGNEDGFRTCGFV